MKTPIIHMIIHPTLICYLHITCCLAACMLIATVAGYSQENVGINTQFPVRQLEVRGDANQFLRIHDSGNVGGETGLELLLGNDVGTVRDYRLSNDAGTFKVIGTNDNFETEGEPLLLINYEGYAGLGTLLPATRLHLEGGVEASNTEHGYLVIGSTSGRNIVLDNNELLARDNGQPASLTLQAAGGTTHIGSGDSHALFAGGGGKVGIGTSSPTARLTIDKSDFQLSLRNAGTGANHWYVGATNNTWLAGPDQLVFSPTNSSQDAVLRLMDVIENDGNTAPVMIRSSASQTLLLDGNEIDSKSGSLYINQNSDQNTYINPTGGRVGIGTTDISTTLQVTPEGTEPALRLEYNDVFWDVDPNTAVNWLGFNKNGWVVGHVNGTTGQWVTISDRQVKREITPLESVLDRVLLLDVREYAYAHDPAGRRQTGLLAQQVQPLFPEIALEEQGQFSVAYSKLSVLILKALQEQQAEIAQLEDELSRLTASLSGN